MAKKKYRIYKAGGAQQGRVMNPTAKFLAKAQMGMQQPSPEEMEMMEQQAMQQQGQPQMSEEQMMQQQEQVQRMVIELIEDYAELTQADPKKIYETLQATENPQEQQAMLDQMAEVVQKANAGAEEEVEAAEQPMSKGGYVKSRLKQLKKAQEGMETPEELEQTPTINDTPDGRESLVSNFNQSLKSTAQNASYKQQAEQEFDSGNYQFGGGKERRQQRRTNRRLRRAFKDIPMAYGINQMGVPSSGINVFAPAMMQMPSQKEIIKSENAENSEVTNEFNPQGVNIKGSMKYGLFGRPKKYEFEMSGMPGAFTPFMGGMFGAGAMSTGSSGYYRSGTDWQDPVKAYVKFNNEANVVTNADEENKIREISGATDAEVKAISDTNKEVQNVIDNTLDDSGMSLLEQLDYLKSQGHKSADLTPTYTNEEMPEENEKTVEEYEAKQKEAASSNSNWIKQGEKLGFDNVDNAPPIEVERELNRYIAEGKEWQDLISDREELEKIFFTGEKNKLTSEDLQWLKSYPGWKNSYNNWKKARSEKDEDGYSDLDRRYNQMLEPTSFFLRNVTGPNSKGEAHKSYKDVIDEIKNDYLKKEPLEGYDIVEGNFDARLLVERYENASAAEKAELEKKFKKARELTAKNEEETEETSVEDIEVEAEDLEMEVENVGPDQLGEGSDAYNQSNISRRNPLDNPNDSAVFYDGPRTFQTSVTLKFFDRVKELEAKAEKAILNAKTAKQKKKANDIQKKVNAIKKDIFAKLNPVNPVNPYALTRSFANTSPEEDTLFTNLTPAQKLNSMIYGTPNIKQDGGEMDDPFANIRGTGEPNLALPSENAYGLSDEQLAVGKAKMQDFFSKENFAGGLFNNMNYGDSVADDEWSMTSPEQLEAQKEINEYQVPKTFDDVSEEELEEVVYSGDLDTLKQNINDTVAQFAAADPNVQKILDEQGVAAAIASSDVIKDTINQEFSAAFLAAINDTVNIDLVDMYNDVLSGKKVDSSLLNKYYGDSIDVANLDSTALAKKMLPIVAQQLYEPMGLTDYLEAIGWTAGGIVAARYGYKKFKGRIPRGTSISDFGFKPQKALPGGKSTVTPMFKRKSLPPGSGSSYSKSGKSISNRVTVPRSVPRTAAQTIAKSKPSYWSRFLQGAKGLAKGMGKRTPMLAPIWGLMDTEEDKKDDLFYQLYKPSTSTSGRRTMSLQGGGSVNIDDPMYGNPDLYKFTGGGQDFMGYGGIPMAQFGYANVDEDLTDEERTSFTQTPEFGEAARSMLDEDLYGGRGMGYDDMQYAASENLGYNEDKGDQVADYYDNILTDQGPAAFQNAINEGQDSYVSAIPFANNTNPFPAEVISNPQMEALQNYTAPEDLREQGYLNNNLEAQQQYLAPGEQYNDVQWDDYQYGGYLMRAQDGVSGIKNPDGPMPGFTWEEWEELSQEEQKQAIQGSRDARNQYATQRQQVQQPINQTGFNPFGALAGALTGMPYGMGNSRQKVFNNAGGYWKQTGFPAGTIDPSNITRVHTEGKRGLFGPKGKMDIYFGGSGEAAADGVPQGSADAQRRGFPDMSYDARAERAEGRFDRRAQNAVDRRERRDARPGERAARQEGRQLNREERQFERNRRQNIRQGRGDTGGFDRDAAIARRAATAEQAANSQQVIADPNPGYSTDKLNKFKAGDMSRGQLRKADFNRSERKQYRQGDAEGASEARKNRRRAERLKEKQYGGYYQEGGEYDLTTEEILEIMAAGGQIEFI